MPDYTLFVAEYPEFAALPEAAVTVQLRRADLMLSINAWGKWLCMAQNLYTAHHLALEYDMGEACADIKKRNPYDVGTINSQNASTSSLAITSVTSALVTGDDPVLSGFARTTYGMGYLELLYTVIPAGGVVYSADTSESQRR